MRKTISLVLSVMCLQCAYTQSGYYNVLTDHNGAEVLAWVQNGNTVPITGLNVHDDGFYEFKRLRNTRRFFVLSQDPIENMTPLVPRLEMLFFYNNNTQQWYRIIWPNETKEQLLIVRGLSLGVNDDFLSVRTESGLLIEFQYKDGIWKFISESSVRTD